MDVHDTSITPASYFPVEQLQIGGSNSGWEGLVDYRTRLSKFVLGHIPAYVGEPKPTKSADMVNRFRSGHAYKRTTAYHCNFAGDDCWYVRVHPKIDTISATSGYTTGFQNLTITGMGLNGTAVSVTVDDIACDIQTQTSEKLICLTGVQSSPTVSTAERPGQLGLSKIVYNPSDGGRPGFDDFTGTVEETSLATSLES